MGSKLSQEEILDKVMDFAEEDIKRFLLKKYPNERFAEGYKFYGKDALVKRVVLETISLTQKAKDEEWREKLKKLHTYCLNYLGIDIIDGVIEIFETNLLSEEDGENYKPDEMELPIATQGCNTPSTLRIRDRNSGSSQEDKLPYKTYEDPSLENDICENCGELKRNHYEVPVLEGQKPIFECEIIRGSGKNYRFKPKKAEENKVENDICECGHGIISHCIDSSLEDEKTSCLFKGCNCKNFKKKEMGK